MGNREHASKLLIQAVQAATDKSRPTNLSTAYQLFASACLADPTWGDSFYVYGNNNYDLKKFDAAIGAYRRALQGELSDDTRASAILNLAWALYVTGKTQEGYEMTQKAGKLKPDNVHYWTNLSVLYQLLGKQKEQVEAAEKAVLYAEKELAAGPTTMAEGQIAIGAKDQTFLEKQLTESKVALAFACLFDGQYQRGFELFEIRFEWRLHHYLQYPYPKWTGESDKTVFLSADQGLGDTLCFARFVEETCRRSKYVHAYIQPALMRVFIHALGHLPNLNLIPYGNAYPQADAWTTFVSLPYALKLSDQQIRETKQIAMSVFSLPTTWMVPDVKLHVGVAWAGSPLNDIDIHRNIPIKYFYDLYKVPGIQLYGLQVGERSKELWEDGAPSLIRDLSPYINDVADTVSLLQNIDLVICCESALGHICAAAGKECWIPYSWQGRDYRIGAKGEKLLWTPQHRIFRQTEDHAWGPVFDRIRTALKEEVYARSRAGRTDYFGDRSERGIAPLVGAVGRPR